MGRHHFFTSPELVAGGGVGLVGEEAHHAARVLRVRTGESITVADGTGRVFDAVVTEISDDAVRARVILERTHRVPRPVLVLAQAVARKERMELVVQKAVEVGARRIMPFLAERSIVRWDDAKRAKAAERWDAIALAAAKQCRSPWLTDVAPVEADIASLSFGEAAVVVLHEEASEKLRDVLPEVAPAAVAIVVGPEGGLTGDEVRAVTDRGGVAATLGERILRTETAGPVALALAAYTYGALG